MKFCSVCDNMMYLSLHEEDDKRLMFRCKYCTHEEPAHGEGTPTQVLGKDYIHDQTKYHQYLNPNIKFDPTLPRVNTIKCVHASTTCTKPADVEDEVIFVKYDRTEMKYLYYCCHCESFWKL